MFLQTEQTNHCKIQTKERTGYELYEEVFEWRTDRDRANLDRWRDMEEHGELPRVLSYSFLLVLSNYFFDVCQCHCKN